MAGKLLGFPQLFSRMRNTYCTVTSSSSSSSSSYSSSSFSPPFQFSFPWPASCSLPRTLSFRSTKEEESSATELPCQSNSSLAAAADEEAAAERKSFSSTVSEDSVGVAVEAVIRRLQSVDRRLFFEPGSATSSSIVEASGAGAGVPFEGSVAVAVESVDPYGDFRRSMEEMLAARVGGGGDRTTAAAAEWLEEMLRWYLKANAKRTHGVIVLAFMDLLSSPPPPPLLSSSSSAATFETEGDGKRSCKRVATASNISYF